MRLRQIGNVLQDELMDLESIGARIADDGLGQGEMILNDVLNVVCKDGENKTESIVNWLAVNLKANIDVQSVVLSKIGTQKFVLPVMANQWWVREIPSGKGGELEIMAMSISWLKDQIKNIAITLSTFLYGKKLIAHYRKDGSSTTLMVSKTIIALRT